jgi:hypothetical protein
MYIGQLRIRYYQTETKTEHPTREFIYKGEGYGDYISISKRNN